MSETKTLDQERMVALKHVLEMLHEANRKVNFLFLPEDMDRVRALVIASYKTLGNVLDSYPGGSP